MSTCGFSETTHDTLWCISVLGNEDKGEGIAIGLLFEIINKVFICVFYNCVKVFIKICVT